jgi:hypothetical protein
MMQDGKMMAMDKDMTMKNGTMVMADGKVKMKSGKTMMLKDGYCVDMNGKVIKGMKMKGMKKGSVKINCVTPRQAPGPWAGSLPGRDCYIKSNIILPGNQMASF